jgi:hypothetical protein
MVLAILFVSRYARVVRMGDPVDPLTLGEVCIRLKKKEGGRKW